MNSLAFPRYQFRLKEEGGKQFIFDPIRRKFILLTPEEWVRQHLINFLMDELGYSRGLISVERSLTYNKRLKRSDLLVYDTFGKPLILAECKSYQVKLSQSSFDQVATYNHEIGARYLLVTNGLQHFCCEVDFQHKSYRFIKGLPHADETLSSNSGSD